MGVNTATRKTPGRILVAGAIAAHPIGGGGNTWAFLQYLLGFRQLGFEVFYVEELPSQRCIDEAWRPVPFRRSYNARYTQRVMEELDLADHVAVWLATDPTVGIGLPFEQMVAIARSTDAIVNLSGRLHRAEILSGPAKRIYVDLDPGFTQIWQAGYGVDMHLRNHDVYFTVGLCLGQPHCRVPTCGIQWHATLPPVVLDAWATSHPPGSRYTTVADWRGYSPVQWNGEWYGQKSEEFLRLLDLPRSSPAPLELCLAIHPDEPDLPRLVEAGWNIVDPKEHAATPAAYRHYIQSSRGEFTVVKNGYRVGHTGWFSDRTACYLAAGRPAVVQDTGYSEVLPTGHGLLPFGTFEEARDALLAVEGNYDHHAAGALALAREYFDAQRVLQRMLDIARV